jgi:hypothetical protein
MDICRLRTRKLGSEMTLEAIRRLIELGLEAAKGGETKR